MLTGRPATAMSWSYRFADGETPVGEVEVSTFRDRGRVVVGAADSGTEYTVERTSLRGPFELRAAGDGVLAAGDKVLAAAYGEREGYRLVLGDAELELRALDPVRMDFVLQERGEPVGSLRHDGTLNRPVEADLPVALAPELRLFAIWPALLEWKRNPSSFGGID